MQAYEAMLELTPLTFEVECRKLWIEDYPEELEEDFDYTLCCYLEEVAHRWGLGDLISLLKWDLEHKHRCHLYEVRISTSPHWFRIEIHVASDLSLIPHGKWEHRKEESDHLGGEWSMGPPKSLGAESKRLAHVKRQASLVEIMEKIGDNPWLVEQIMEPTANLIINGATKDVVLLHLNLLKMAQLAYPIGVVKLAPYLPLMSMWTHFKLAQGIRSTCF